MKPEVVRTHSFNEEVARFIADTARDSIDRFGWFRLALSGGNTPRGVYQALSLVECDWAKWIITFGDERCVPPDDSQSNFRMASESLLMMITPGEVLRMKGELPPEQAASDYDSAIKSLAERFGEPRFRHDLILLGLGDDGHTASLFPGTAALQEKEKNVVANFVPKFNTHRLTFSYPLINAGRRVAFLVNDSKKKTVVDGVLQGGRGFPAEGIKPTDGELLWFLGA